MEDVLRQSPIPDEMKDKAWNAFIGNGQPEQFKASFDKLEGVPNPLKLQLAKLRFGLGPAQPPTAPPASNVGAEPKADLGPPAVEFYGSPYIRSGLAPGPPKPPKPPLPWETAVQQPNPKAHDIPQRLLDQTAAGVGRVARGIEGMTEPGMREKAGGLHEAASGAFQAATIPMIGVGGAAPLKTAGALAAGVVSQQAVERGLTAIGLPKEYAAVAGDLAAVIAGAKASGAVEAIDKATPGGGGGNAAEIKAKVEPILKERMAAAGKPLRPPLKKPSPPPEPPPTTPAEAPTKAETAPAPPTAPPPSGPPAEPETPATPKETPSQGPQEMPPPEKYAGGDAEFAGKVSKARAMKARAAKKSALPPKKGEPKPPKFDLAAAKKAPPGQPPSPPVDIARAITEHVTKAPSGGTGVPKNLLIETPGAALPMKTWVKPVSSVENLQEQISDIVKTAKAQGYTKITVQPANSMKKGYGEPMTFEVQ